MFLKVLPKRSSRFKQVSPKILAILTLNDTIIVSASAHYIINNIFMTNESLEKLDIDIKTRNFASVFFLKAEEDLRNLPDNVAPLEKFSKFELLLTNLLLLHLKIGGKEDETVPLSRGKIIELLTQMIEVKICVAYPYLVIPIFKIF